jgi:hypothetical protein
MREKKPAVEEFQGGQKVGLVEEEWFFWARILA